MSKTSTIEIAFSPMTARQEHSLLTEDDQEFPNTKIYLRPLIIEALDRSNLPREIYDSLYQRLISDVPVAARRFLFDEKKEYRFSTYFTLYIQERLNMAEEMMKNGVDIETANDYY